MSDDQLYDRVAEILEQAKSQVARTVNTAMVQAYWLIGREIVEVEQAGEARAGYGDEIIELLSTRLRTGFGKGFSAANLRKMRQFYLAFPSGSALPEIRSTLSSELPGPSDRSTRSTPRSELLGGRPARFSEALAWSHYLVLMRVVRPEARAFYEIEAARECWSVRELERQIGSLLYDRIARQRAPNEVRALARQGQEIAKPSDVIKDPFVLEFLDLGDRKV
jgi:hypothetical protein